MDGIMVLIKLMNCDVQEVLILIIINNLLVADQENHRIIKVQLSPEIFIESGETMEHLKLMLSMID